MPLKHQTIYIELGDPAGKKPPIVNEHRVWDSQRFIAAQREQYAGPSTKADERRNVAVVGREEYVAFRRGEHRA